MKIFIALFFCLGAVASSFAQELSMEYHFSTNNSEHYVVNYPEDSTHLQWGIWLNAQDSDFSFHTMKLFLNKDQALFLEHFQGIGEIILNDNERIPMTVYWFETGQGQFSNFDKVLAIQFNENESELLMENEVKKIVFYTSYGKFTAKFARKDMIQNALFTLKYNMDIYNQVKSVTLTSNYELK